MRHHPQPTGQGRLALEHLEDRATPATLAPVYSATFADAVTADNAFTGTGGGRYWSVDPGADRYQTDTYERPTAQTYVFRPAAGGGGQFAASEYYQNLDVVQARAGHDADFLYVAVKMAGLSKMTSDGKATNEGLAYQYGFRIATQEDGGGGLLVVSDQPQFKNAPRTAFGSVGTFVYRDANGDVGGTGRDVTKQDRQAEVGGNGYDRVVASDGKLSSGQKVLFVRVNPADPTEVEFALNYKAVGYTAEQLAGLPYFVAEANKGTKDPGNYLWNDEYTRSEAGSPYRATSGNLSKSEFGTQGLGNIYELDTVDLGPLTPPPAPVELSGLSGFVYEDDATIERPNGGIGFRDPGEPGIEGVEIRLFGVNDLGEAVTMTTFTDADGFYVFSDLRPGTYSIQEVQPAGYQDGRETAGTVDGRPSGQVGDPDNDQISGIVLGEGEFGEDYNFGEFAVP